MSDMVLSDGVFDQVLKPGTYATPSSNPGLTIQERPDVVLLQIIARKNRVARLADALAQFLGREVALGPMGCARANGLLICATGPQEYWILAPGRDALQTIDELHKITGQSASIFDQSDARITIRLTGNNAADVLAKGTALDLSGHDPAASASHTVIEHISALIVRYNEPSFYDVMIPRSYAGSFAMWLCGAARDYGYLIEGPGTQLEK